jgi:hypothetical protein
MAQICIGHPCYKRHFHGVKDRAIGKQLGLLVNKLKDKSCRSSRSPAERGSCTPEIFENKRPLKTGDDPLMGILSQQQLVV